jgi:hypothetical protein
MILTTLLELSGLLGKVKGNLGLGSRECSGEKVTLVKGAGPKESSCLRCGTSVKKGQAVLSVLRQKIFGTRRYPVGMGLMKNRSKQASIERTNPAHPGLDRYFCNQQYFKTGITGLI